MAGGEATVHHDQGGVLVGGKAIVTEDGEYYDVMEGGVQVGGYIFETYNEFGHRGALVGGSARVGFFENTCGCMPSPEFSVSMN